MSEPTYPTVYEMTRMLLAETAAPRVLAAWDAVPPNRAGHPKIGVFGFMDGDDLYHVAKAADIAHRQANTEGWATHVESVEFLVAAITTHGSWRFANDPHHGYRHAAERAYRGLA